MIDYEVKNQLTGKGWGFPPTFVKGANQVLMTQDEVNINENITLLFKTRVGERGLNPTYGSKLSDYMFSAQNGIVVKELEHDLKHVLELYEPRIKAEEVTIELENQENGLIVISVAYELLKVNSRHNYVFPFYINEGTYLDI